MSGERMGLPQVGTAADVLGLTRVCRAYLEWLGVKGYSERTVLCRETELRFFLRWCDARELERACDVTRSLLERYQRHLAHYRKRDEQRLSISSQRGRLNAVRGLFKWLARSRQILHNPAADLELPRQPQRLPRYVLSESEAEVVLEQPDTSTPEGLRDRAVLEVLYSTGMRRFELCQLALTDLDAERGTVLIRQGKGKKDRMIPIGARALAWVSRYLDHGRGAHVVEPDGGLLFLSLRGGGPMSEDDLTRRVAAYVKQSELGKSGACHLFRHTMATLMLENGADVRFIQEMLGHARLTTTERYTRVSIRQLKEVHRATHPGAEEKAS